MASARAAHDGAPTHALLDPVRGLATRHHRDALRRLRTVLEVRRRRGVPREPWPRASRQGAASVPAHLRLHFAPVNGLLGRGGSRRPALAAAGYTTLTDAQGVMCASGVRFCRPRRSPTPPADGQQNGPRRALGSRAVDGSIDRLCTAGVLPGGRAGTARAAHCLLGSAYEAAIVHGRDEEAKFFPTTCRDYCSTGNHDLAGGQCMGAVASFKMAAPTGAP